MHPFSFCLDELRQYISKRKALLEKDNVLDVVANDNENFPEANGRGYRGDDDEYSDLDDGGYQMELSDDDGENSDTGDEG